MTTLCFVGVYAAVTGHDIKFDAGKKKSRPSFGLQ